MGMDRDRLRAVLGIGVGIVLVVGFGLSRVIGGAGAGVASHCDDPIAWHDAASVVGSVAAIAGPVARASYEPDVGGGPTFLNLGNPYPDPDRFDVVVYEDRRPRFDRPPETAFTGSEVCVEGRVRDRDGVPQIVLDGPAFITPR